MRRDRAHALCARRASRRVPECSSGGGSRKCRHCFSGKQRNFHHQKTLARQEKPAVPREKYVEELRRCQALGFDMSKVVRVRQDRVYRDVDGAEPEPEPEGAGL